VVSYDSASVQLMGETGNIYVAAGTSFAKQEPYQSFADDHGSEIIERFSKEKKVSVIADTDKDEDWIYVPGLAFVRSWIGAALMVQGRLIGVLNVDNSRPNAYNNKIAETVLTFANQAAVAIENARLYEETSQRANEMMALHQVALATSILPDIDSLLQQTTELLSESLYPELFGFLLVQEESGQLYPHPSFHGAPQEVLYLPVPIDASVCGTVYKTGQPTIVGDVTTLDKYQRISPSTISEMAVPLTVRDKVIGVINVESSRLNAFSANDLRFLTTLAGQVATFIERLELYQAQRKYTAHLAKEVNQRTIALRSERDRMQAILDNAGEGIFFTDENGVILYVNSTMLNVTGFSVNELLHLPPEQWPGISHSPGLLESLQRAIQEEKRWKSEMVGKKKDNRDYDIYLTVTPIFNSDGTLSGLVGVHSDISYLKEVERLKARFISNVSHELRTPLTVIETYTTLLKQGKPERREHYLDVLGVETKRLTRLIQDVLDLSRLESEKAPILMETLQLDLLITQVANTFLPHAETKNINLQVELEPGLVPIWGNSMQMEQVVTNLVNNALIYTPDSGTVLIKAGMGVKDDVDMIWFSITDTGYGVPVEDIPLIFDRFFRVKSMEAAGIRGTGLGLAICKEIVERHQGCIEVKSEPGQGSVFTVWLPTEERRQSG
jgi:PAS domain S-box-containing protein